MEANFTKNSPTANDTQTKQTSNVADHDVDTNFYYAVQI